MNTLMMLAASSIAWGAVLCVVGLMLQRNSNVSGRTRQWIWRGATLLLLAPWIAAPVVSALGLGLAPAEVVATHEASSRRRSSSRRSWRLNLRRSKPLSWKMAAAFLRGWAG